MATKVLDLFRNWTPEMIEAVHYQGSGCRQRESWASLSDKEKEAKLKKSFHSDEAKEKSQEATKKVWASKSPEEIEAHIRSSFLSPEAIKKSGEGYKRFWASLSEEEKKGYSLKVRDGIISFWDSPQGVSAREVLSIAGKCAWASKSSGEKKEWLEKSCHSKEARLKAKADSGISMGLRRYWASLSQEEYDVRVRSWRESVGQTPTLPEALVGIFLEKEFPGEWIYNGDGLQGVVIGGRVPDFVNVNGKKAVIEVFGDFWHREEEVEVKIEHYKKFGYTCLVIWEHEVYLGELRRGYESNFI